VYGIFDIFFKTFPAHLVSAHLLSFIHSDSLCAEFVRCLKSSKKYGETTANFQASQCEVQHGSNFSMFVGAESLAVQFALVFILLCLDI
jgi:hypothetical protein